MVTTLTGTTGDDTFILVTTDDYFVSLLAGDDEVIATGALVSTTLIGAEGRDSILVVEGEHLIYGNKDIDSVLAVSAETTIFTGQGNDSINLFSGTNLVYGNKGNDKFLADVTVPPASTLYGGQGNDVLSLADGTFLVYGNIGADVVVINDGDAVEGISTVFGGQDNDDINAVSTLTSEVIIYGNKGRDDLDGGGANDTIYGGQDDDSVEGDSGDDHLFGNLGDDFLVGATLTGDTDVMVGGAGEDSFVINYTEDSITPTGVFFVSNLTIVDFNIEDTLVFDDSADLPMFFLDSDALVTDDGTDVTIKLTNQATGTIATIVLLGAGGFGISSLTDLANTYDVVFT